jgi:EAL domain-containing protein (putative c-di-GMP-specific phosphodiesterase class I)/CHASE2 domain-containing sensor protein
MASLLDTLLKVTRRGERWWRVGTVAAAMTVGIAAASSGASIGLERALGGWSASVRAQPASGGLHIVEVDARSIAAINHWPWPREHHAKVIDRLHAAGVATIAFDIDFSSRSTRAQDAALAAAITRAEGKVVLPTFRQDAGGGRDGFTDSLPAPALRDHAALAAVSVRPDGDGLVRVAPLGTTTQGVPRPSLSAMLAGRPGAVEDDFPIDYAIDPATIPRHSFVDIRDGRFDPRALAGKQVLIGATAIEIGDRYAVPRYGVIPGVVIQALAAETLMHGVPVQAGWLPPFLLAILLAWAVVRARASDVYVAAVIGAPTFIVTLDLAAQVFAGMVFNVAPGLILVVTASAMAAASRLVAMFGHRRAHDEATGLPNRIALVETLAGERDAAIVVARIGGFDQLSAALGAEATAQLVHRICDRLRLVGEGIIIHRIDGRVLAWRASAGVDVVEERYATLRALMLQPVEVGGRRVDVTLSIGFAALDDGESAGALANAMVAAEVAAQDGAGWHVHATDDADALDRELTLLAELNDAVRDGQLLAHYQPKLDLETGQIASVEALVRWQHPTRGLIRPDLFIPLAERNDRIAELTLAVLARTIADVQRWAAAGHAITAAVNVSAKLLSSGPFITEVRALIDATRIVPAALTFEVTESAAMLDPNAATAALQMFRDLGVHVSMDDYGTGQSTLTYLKRLPLDEVKIDRSFVQFAHQNRGDAILVRSTIELAHELGLKVVAEGVEDAECLAFLRTVGCDLAQGYFISRPVDADALEALLVRGVEDRLAA